MHRHSSDRITAATGLMIEDDPESRLLLRRVLERAGLAILEAESGQEGLRMLYAERPEIVLLDMGMCGLDGWQTLVRIRELSQVPVMVVSGKGSELDKVRAFDCGADDYVTKPFGMQEIVARVESLLRREAGTKQAPAPYRDSFVEIDYLGAEAIAQGQQLRLTPLEFRLLSTFVDHPNEVISAERLLAFAWRDGESGHGRDRVKIYVGYLRAKFREAGVEVPIETVRGFGYRYRPELPLHHVAA